MGAGWGSFGPQAPHDNRNSAVAAANGSAIIHPAGLACGWVSSLNSLNASGTNSRAGRACSFVSRAAPNAAVDRSRSFHLRSWGEAARLREARNTPSISPTVGKFCTPAKPSAFNWSRKRSMSRNGSVPLTPASTGVFVTTGSTSPAISTTMALASP